MTVNSEVLNKFKNKHAWFKTTLPSTGQEIRYRAMVLKENMEISLAFSENKESAMETLYTMMESCIKEEIDFRELPMYDVEWLMLNIQKKSSGETKQVTYKCSECDEPNEIMFDLSKARIKNAENATGTSKIDSGSYMIEVQYPRKFNALDYTGLDENDMESNVKILFDLCCASIIRAYDEEDVLEASSLSKEDMFDFVTSQSQETLQKFSEFFAKMPKTVVDIEFDCKRCKHHNKEEIGDIQNFF